MSQSVFLVVDDVVKEIFLCLLLTSFSVIHPNKMIFNIILDKDNMIYDIDVYIMRLDPLSIQV